MRLTLRLSPSLQTTIDGNLELLLEGVTIEQCIHQGIQTYPDLEKLLFKDGTLNPQILLFHNDELIKQNKMNSVVKEKDVLDVIPAIEGG